jgi:hypothetical protein
MAISVFALCELLAGAGLAQRSAQEREIVGRRSGRNSGVIDRPIATSAVRENASFVTRDRTDFGDRNPERHAPQLGACSLAASSITGGHLPPLSKSRLQLVHRRQDHRRRIGAAVVVALPAAAGGDVLTRVSGSISKPHPRSVV